MANHLIIIGNGFDLSLGLKTGYKDFMESKDFHNLLKNQNALAGYLKNVKNLQGWIDIEKEFSKYAIGQNPNRLKQEYEALKAALMDYLGGLNYDSINQNSQAQAFKFIEKAYQQSGEIQIINFNYTNTVDVINKKISRSYQNLTEPKELKIHGSLKDKNIVFGVEDNAIKDTKYLFMQKSYAKAFANVSIKNEAQQFNKISIFGHSLGDTDAMHFDFLSEYTANTGTKEFNFYYYGENGWESLQQQINKLTGGHLGPFKKNNRINFIDTSLPV